MASWNVQIPCPSEKKFLYGKLWSPYICFPFRFSTEISRPWKPKPLSSRVSLSRHGDFLPCPVHFSSSRSWELAESLSSALQTGVRWTPLISEALKPCVTCDQHGVLTANTAWLKFWRVHLTWLSASQGVDRDVLADEMMKVLRSKGHLQVRVAMRVRRPSSYSLPCIPQPWFILTIQAWDVPISDKVHTCLHLCLLPHIHRWSVVLSVDLWM